MATTKPERKSYYTYFFGQNMIYGMISGYLTTFLLLIGVNPVKSAAVKLAAAISGSMGLALLGMFGFKSEFVIDGVKQQVSNFADLEKINAIAQQTSEALDGLWFTYNIVPIIGLVIALIIWNFYKLNDKDVQIMADCNVGKITKDEAEKRLSKKY